MSRLAHEPWNPSLMQEIDKLIQEAIDEGAPF